MRLPQNTFENARLLIVDDPSSAKALHEILESACYHNVRIESDLSETLRVCEEFHPDIVLPYERDWKALEFFASSWRGVECRCHRA
jgi:PleD family two-component response regulator